MGLMTGLLTLPLAPMRGVVWIAEQVHEQARREFEDPAVIRRRLAEVEQARADGDLTEEEAADLEEELVRRLMAAGSAADGPEV
jgi:cytochrome c-type biogenesis protein CcmI